MYIIKNAIKSITRNKGKHLLVLSVILIITIASCVALCIKDAADELVNSYKENYDVKAQIGLDRGSIRKNNISGKDTFNPQDIMNNIKELTVEEIINYGNSIYVKDYDYSVETSLNSNTLEVVSMSSNGMTMSSEINMGDGKGFVKNPDFTLVRI